MKFSEPAKSRGKKPQGFILIIGMIIFGIFAIVLIDLQMTVMDTYNSIKESNNYMSAQRKADSIMELVQFKTKNYEAGFNSGEIICGYGKFAPTPPEQNPAFCNDVTTPDPGKAQQDIRITIKVKGRNEDEEKIKSGNCDFDNNGCYVVPSPGTGDAGDKDYCKIYESRVDFVNTPNASDNVNNEDFDLTNGNPNLDQLDYGCNWNRLRLGSTMTDRVAIPLYYDEAELGEDSGIVNVFKAGTSLDFKADNILVRVRTPCVPCGDEIDGAIRYCDETVKDETVCTDNERYVLDDGGTTVKNPKNDIVVQWLINGECGEGGGKLGFCGVIPIGDKTKLPAVISAFYESKINEAKDDGDYILIKNNTITYDTNDYPDLVALLTTDEETIPIKLPLMSKPVLTLFLSHPLLTDVKDRIPYLEYQVLTDKPVSSNESVLEVNVVVNTNGFTRTITKDVPKALIDFAIQTN